MTPAWFYVLVVVRRDDRFLLVHERKHGKRWYLPAGRVEPGETLVAAAERETLEEAGIRVRVTGIVRFEHTPTIDGTRVRVIFTAEPKDDAEPKSEPDEESLGADWFAVEEMAGLSLRGEDVVRFCRHLESGGQVAPLEMLGREG